MTPKSLPDYGDVLDAANRIANYIHHTPVLTSSFFNDLTKSEIFFKCENLQKVGAFKFRGASNAVFSKSIEEIKNGVATHSSGNHAQAVALAASMRGIKATIVMPENAPKVKVEAVKGYGAEIVFCEPTIDARESTLQELIREKGACFIHPYNDATVIAGQGTAAKELLEEIPDLDILLTPVGGGGLLSGSSIAAKAIRPAIRVIGAEPERADDACRSFRSGRLQPALRTDTIADGLRTSLGELPFEIIKQKTDEMVTVTEEDIIRDMRRVWERMKILIEPSSAVPVSAVLSRSFETKNKKIGIILTGGNVDLETLPWLS